MSMSAKLTLIALVTMAPATAFAQTAVPPPLTLETTIPLGAVSGRIDHLDIDLKHRHLFVAELGNDSLGIIDLAQHSVLRTITGLSEPQGVGYLELTDTIYVADGGDGSVRAFAGTDFRPLQSIALGRDADNVRVDESAGRIYVGHGDGGIAAIDRTSRVVAEIALPAHPESFQFDAKTHRLYVNLPDADQVGVVDLSTAKEVALWPMRGARGNFPMALDRAAGRLFVGTRNPPRLLALAADGAVATSAPLCGDADDLFVDAKRSWIYASCGEGEVDVFDAGSAGLTRIGEVQTSPGARTSLWVPALDRLFVAVRADANDDYNRCASQQDPKASFACIEQLAQSGNATAQLALGGFYAGGYGVPQDQQQAASWYQKAAEQGNAVAMSKLGDAYLTGTGVTQDYGQAASWFGRAASAGDAWSLEKLGSLYETGQGVGQDNIAAYQWYDIAAARGDSHAADLRDALAQKMAPDQIAEAKKRSSDWLLQSAALATTAGHEAAAKAVSDCAAVVRGSNASPYDANFEAVYKPATGLIEYTGAEEQAPVAAFNQCMTAKGYQMGAMRAE